MRGIPAFIGLAFLLASCMPAPASPGGSGATGGSAPSAKTNFGPSSTLSIKIDGPWATFDPVAPGGNLGSTQLNAAFYDRLVALTPDKQIVPYIASEWEQTGSTLKFTLKKTVTCNDGTPLTASMVAKSFDRGMGISNPATKSAFVASEFGPGPFTVSADDTAGVFTLTLGTPWGEALQSMATGSVAYVVCPKGLEPDALQDAAHGTGPYNIASGDRSTGMTVKLRNEWAWGPNGRTAEGMPGEIVFKIVTNETTAANLLLTGGLDIARVQGSEVQRLVQNNSLGQLKTTSWFTNPLWLNPSAGHPTSDVAVREAIATAVSAEGWVQAAYGGQGTPTTSFIATDAPCFNPDTANLVPRTDIARAKQVLTNAGYTADSTGKLSKDGQPLTIKVVGSVIQAPGPEYIQSQLVQLGVNVEFISTEHVTYSSSYLQPGNFDVIVPGIASDFIGSYIAFMSGSPPPAGRNFSRIQDSALDEQIGKALQVPMAGNCDAWNTIQADYLKKFYFRPLAAQNFMWFSRNPSWRFNAHTSYVHINSLN